MVSRALHLTRRQVPFLEGVTAGPDGAFLGLDETLRDVDTGEARTGLLRVLTSLIDLLVGFIGEELTLRLVDEVWPEPLLSSIQPGKSEDQEATP